jgi:hypothetical protein
MNKWTTMMILAATMTLIATNASAERARVAGARANAQGGTTAGSAAAGTTAAGGRYARGAGVATDGAGNAVGGSGAAVQTANGSTAARGGAFQRNADGSFQRGGGFAVSGVNGTAQSQGTVSGDGQGHVVGSRSTQATSTSGATYDGQTDFDSETGVSHTGTCTDASGNAVACPKPK